MKYLVLLLLPISFGVLANHKLTTDQLSGHVGKKVTVCGKVANFPIKSDTFINLDSPHPYQVLFYANNQTIGLNKLFKTVWYWSFNQS